MLNVINSILLLLILIINLLQYLLSSRLIKDIVKVNINLKEEKDIEKEEDEYVSSTASVNHLRSIMRG